MRFFAPLIAAAAVFGLSTATPMARQEAARFGSVAVSPSSAAPGETVTVLYNSTTARSHPEFVDIYIQGDVNGAGTFFTPYFLLGRNSYNASETTLSIQAQIPADLQGQPANSTYLVWAFTTFPTSTGALEVGGISTPIGITGN